MNRFAADCAVAILLDLERDTLPLLRDVFGDEAR